MAITKCISSSGYNVGGRAAFKMPAGPLQGVDRSNYTFNPFAPVINDDDFGQLIKFNDVLAATARTVLFSASGDGGTLNYMTVANIGPEAMTLYINGNNSSGHVLAGSGSSLTLDNVLINELQVSSATPSGFARGFGLRTPDLTKTYRTR